MYEFRETVESLRKAKTDEEKTEDVGDADREFTRRLGLATFVDECDQSTRTQLSVADNVAIPNYTAGDQ